MADDKKFDLSRRKVLGSIGTIGVASAAAGAGTMAYFKDEEQSTGNSLTAGTLDLETNVSYTQNMGFKGSDNGSGASVSIGDVKPGDDGHIKICFTPSSNPAWIWMKGERTKNGDNLNTEPEEEAEGGSVDGNGELAANINATLQYNYGNNQTVGSASGTLNDVLNAINSGVPLDNDPSTTDTDHFAADNQRCVKIVWNVPTDVGNVIQGDEVKFDLSLWAQQRRHQPSPSNPWS